MAAVQPSKIEGGIAGCSEILNPKRYLGQSTVTGSSNISMLECKISQIFQSRNKGNEITQLTDETGSTS